MASEAMQAEIDHVLSKFSGELLKLFQKAVVQAVTGRSTTALAPATPRRSRTAKPAAPAPAKPAKGAKGAKPSRRGRGGPKSSPEEVTKLGDKLVDILRRKGEAVTAKDLLKAAGVDSGQFHYALSKAKAAGRIHQIGERRMARYELGSGKSAPKAAKAAKGKAKPARKPRKAAPAAAAVAEPPAEPAAS
jgi:hypothetical protein